MSKLTPAMRHAILLLEIQDAKRGWVRHGILAYCGVKDRTLAVLQRIQIGLVEQDVPPDATQKRDWRWRLTGRGEREAARLKKLGKKATVSDTETVTASVRG